MSPSINLSDVTTGEEVTPSTTTTVQRHGVEVEAPGGEVEPSPHVAPSRPAAESLRDQGISDVLAADCAPHRQYATLAQGVVLAYPSGWRFNAEDVRADVTNHHPGAPEPHSPGLLGGVIRGLSEQGLIRAVGWAQSTRASSRCRPVRVWQVT